MIQITHEAPLCLMEKVKELTDYDYALVHLLCNEEYRYFFQKSLSEGRKVILDNSIYELGEAFTGKEYAQEIENLQPSEYLLPDVFDNKDATIHNSEKFFLEFGQDLSSEPIGVLQGNTYEELVDCYQFFGSFGINKIAFPFLSKAFIKQAPTGFANISRSIGRFVTIVKMIQEDHIDPNVRHHVLGCNSLMEYALLSEFEDFIETADTSYPITKGLAEQEVSISDFNKSSVKINDIFFDKFKFNAHIHYNITVFRNAIRAILV